MYASMTKLASVQTFSTKGMTHLFRQGGLAVANTTRAASQSQGMNLKSATYPPVYNDASVRMKILKSASRTAGISGHLSRK